MPEVISQIALPKGTSLGHAHNDGLKQRIKENLLCL